MGRPFSATSLADSIGWGDGRKSCVGFGNKAGGKSTISRMRNK